MSYADQDMFFAEAYKTGDDHWTDIPIKRHIKEITTYIPKGSTVLDIGAGRGKILFELHNLGFRVVGLENNSDLVVAGNNEIKEKNYDRESRFVFGNALNMPFVPMSFFATIDVGLMHHILPNDYPLYIAELSRVLKQGGFLFLAVLSKNTKKYFQWKPITDTKNDYEIEGVHYHFFSDEEINNLFGNHFEIIELKSDTPFGEEDTVYTIALLKKK